MNETIKMLEIAVKAKREELQHVRWRADQLRTNASRMDEEAHDIETAIADIEQALNKLKDR